jgi:transposase
MTLEVSTSMLSMVSLGERSGDMAMVHKERWEEIQRLFHRERYSISAIARQLGVDRKTVRRCLRQNAWQPYQRAAKEETLLAAHEGFLRERAPQVRYSARILHQELCRDRSFTGSYDVVKRFVAPLRALEAAAGATQTRFETPPGQQSQVDWGQARVEFRCGTRSVHIFVLTLGFCRRGFYWSAPNEQLGAFLEAHERAFEHFGGHTREHLYDRTRTVCRPNESGHGTQWNGTFYAFSKHWDFEPRVCQPYRACTKGKVESGVKFVKGNFLPGRTFTDIVDLQEQLSVWNTDIADARIHGTTHERPIDRFAREREHLISSAGHPSFLTDVRLARLVASDYLVTVDTNRYSVPFHLIGQVVEVENKAGQVRFFHRGELVADHVRLPGRYELSIHPEHGPGALARNVRRRRSSLIPSHESAHLHLHQVEVRDLSIYEHLASSDLGASQEVSL